MRVCACVCVRVCVCVSLSLYLTFSWTCFSESPSLSSLVQFALQQPNLTKINSNETKILPLCPFEFQLGQYVHEDFASEIYLHLIHFSSYEQEYFPSFLVATTYFHLWKWDSVQLANKNAFGLYLCFLLLGITRPKYLVRIGTQKAKRDALKIIEANLCQD